jgi:hypothetical protein
VKGAGGLVIAVMGFELTQGACPLVLCLKSCYTQADTVPELLEKTKRGY